jgi:hypothetical protein
LNLCSCCDSIRTSFMETIRTEEEKQTVRGI